MSALVTISPKELEVDRAPAVEYCADTRPVLVMGQEPREASSAGVQAIRLVTRIAREQQDYTSDKTGLEAICTIVHAWMLEVGGAVPQTALIPVVTQR